MPSYILRKINPELWARFKARSEAEGIPMRALMLLLVEAYANREVTVSASKPEEAYRGDWQCPRCGLIIGSMSLRAAHINTCTAERTDR